MRPESFGTRRGFRPGKAPRKVLERHFRSEVEGEVAQKVVQETFSEAARVEAIDIVAPPSVSISEGVAAGKPMRYTARVEVRPSIDPKDYKGLEVTRKPPEVSDEMVQKELERMQESFAQLVAVEGRTEAQEGDWAVVDHEGTIDGEPFEGSKGESVTVKIAPGATSEGNLGVLAGKKIGDAVELDETFGEDHRNEALRGKVARMKVTLKGLRARQLPPLDDALVKGLGAEGVETVDQLRARIRADLEQREKHRAEGELKDALLKAALARNEFEVPPSLVERAIDAMIEGAAERFARSGIDIRTLGLDYAKLRADVREQALTQVRGRLLLDAIADAEKLDATEEDIQAELVKLAEDLKTSLPKLQQRMRGKEERETLRNQVRHDKAFALMAQAATVKAP